MRQPPISLVNLTNEEKDKLGEATQRKLKQGVYTYLIPFIVMGIAVACLNVYSEKFGLYDSPNLREWLNLALVIITIVPARLYVNELIRHRKVANAWQKKVIRGKVQAKEGKIMTVANQRIKLSPEEMAKWNVNDFIIVSISTSGDFVLGVEAGAQED